MIRHRPHGSGHPYAETEDQRVPARPLDGESVELRVRASAQVTSVVCEWVVDGAAPVELPLTRRDDPASADAPEGADGAVDGPVDGAVDGAVDRGHLAAAQARAARA
ncbi:hypothetical protein, partial [Nonomuraea antimicrobica]|uniref:hypothetical protein n=1 Tax=Nonomuraea antimicrobica TaxID=561173 RepID=UPI0031E8DB61